MATAAASEGIYEALLIEENSEAKEKRWSAKNLGLTYYISLSTIYFPQLYKPFHKATESFLRFSILLVSGPCGVRINAVPLY